MKDFKPNQGTFQKGFVFKIGDACRKDKDIENETYLKSPLVFKQIVKSPLFLTRPSLAEPRSSIR